RKSSGWDNRLLNAHRNGDQLVGGLDNDADLYLLRNELLLGLCPQAELGLFTVLQLRAIQRDFKAWRLRIVEPQGNNAGQLTGDSYLIGGLLLCAQLRRVLIRPDALPQTLNVRPAAEPRKGASGRGTFRRFHLPEWRIAAIFQVNVPDPLSLLNLPGAGDGDRHGSGEPGHRHIHL